MSAEVRPEELPFTTAPEYVDEFIGDLDVSNEVAKRARRYAWMYGIEKSLNRSPRSIAAASIYWAGLVSNEKLTQGEVQAATDVSQVAIRETYHQIAEEEGHETSSITEVEGRDRGLLDRVKTWGGR